MRHFLIQHPSLVVGETTGNEGPSYDPYYFRELYIQTDDTTVLLHGGLDVYAEINGERVEPPTREDYNNFDRWFNEVAVANTGFRVNDLERWARKSKRQCPSGGHHDAMTMDGFPGETFEVCAKCGKVVDSFFCEGAVI